MDSPGTPPPPGPPFGIKRPGEASPAGPEAKRRRGSTPGCPPSAPSGPSSGPGDLPSSPPGPGGSFGPATSPARPPPWLTPRRGSGTDTARSSPGVFFPAGAITGQPRGPAPPGPAPGHRPPSPEPETAALMGRLARGSVTLMAGPLVGAWPDELLAMADSPNPALLDATAASAQTLSDIQRIRAMRQHSNSLNHMLASSSSLGPDVFSSDGPDPPATDPEDLLPRSLAGPAGFDERPALSTAWAPASPPTERRAPVAGSVGPAMGPSAGWASRPGDSGPRPPPAVEPVLMLHASGIGNDYYRSVMSWEPSELLAVGLESMIFVHGVHSTRSTQLFSQAALPRWSPGLLPHHARTISAVAWGDATTLAAATNFGELVLLRSDHLNSSMALRGQAAILSFGQPLDGLVGALSWRDAGLLSLGSHNGRIASVDPRAGVGQPVLLFDRHRPGYSPGPAAIGNGGSQAGGHALTVCSLAWSPCGRWLASGGSDHLLCLWDPRWPRQPVARVARHQAAVGALAWCSADMVSSSAGPLGPGLADRLAPGTESASPSAEDAWLRYWEGLAEAEHPGLAGGLAGPVLASGGGAADRCIRLWDVLRPAAGLAAAATRWPGLAADPGPAGHVRELFALDTGSQVCGLAFDRSTRQLVSAHGFSSNSLSVWGLRPGVRRRPGARVPVPGDPGWAPAALAGVPRPVPVVLDPVTGRPVGRGALLGTLHRLDPSRFPAPPGPAGWTAAAPLAGLGQPSPHPSLDHHFEVAPAHGDRVLHLALAGDGRHFATASFDRSIRLWDCLDVAAREGAAGRADARAGHGHTHLPAHHGGAAPFRSSGSVDIGVGRGSPLPPPPPPALDPAAGTPASRHRRRYLSVPRPAPAAEVLFFPATPSPPRRQDPHQPPQQPQPQQPQHHPDGLTPTGEDAGGSGRASASPATPARPRSAHPGHAPAPHSASSDEEHPALAAGSPEPWTPSTTGALLLPQPPASPASLGQPPGSGPGQALGPGRRPRHMLVATVGPGPTLEAPSAERLDRPEASGSPLSSSSWRSGLIRSELRHLQFR
ncbi:hypothetical protein H696_00800 [Fonticula alba]|uniref:Anaphase-promoting complex subunit 4 WD40 domain-containing protein n=1 Tax=Fonticula alba TaxID=691883 RepID=A0A058ZFX3_FONAL|nr:hypothetical protein H696_00800 [Fonticula alba]KCV73259.1 hypothetical protein H696_00800 [Fonticula alba]|eukprot:XP_009492960.1 hypothetical protein H696_00800 [Fonticula alba]